MGKPPDLQFFHVRRCFDVVPIPKLTNEALGRRRALGDWAPVPVKGMVLGELGALLTSETLPDALPVVVGANCTLKVLDCPGGRVSGNVSPLMLKPAPVTLP